MTILLWACWGLIAAVWLTGGIYNLLKAPMISRKKIPQKFLIAFFILLFVVQKLNPYHFLSSITFYNVGLSYIGIVILLISTLFTLWSRYVLGKMWAGTIGLKENHQLRTEGPYSITRHPIYTGFLGMMIGSMFVSGSGIALFFFLITLCGFSIKISQEEKLLTETFGSQYEKFKQEVPQIIPGVKFKH